MNDKLTFYDKIVCNTVGKMFELAAEQMSCYETTFCEAWLKSGICNTLLEREPTTICQSKVYFLNSLKKEAGLISRGEHKMDPEVMYWAGYTFTYWMYIKNINGSDIVKLYDLAEILSQYEILHTMSVKAAVKTIENNYTKGQVLLDTILHQEERLE